MPSEIRNEYGVYARALTQKPPRQTGMNEIVVRDPRTETKLERFLIIVTITNNNSDKLTHFQRMHKLLHYILVACENSLIDKLHSVDGCSISYNGWRFINQLYSLIPDGAPTRRLDFSVGKADKVSLLSSQSAHLFVAWMRYSTGNWRFCSKESTGTETNEMLTNTMTNRWASRVQ